MTPKQRILIVMNYYYRKGVNKESVNKVYRNILKLKYASNRKDIY